MTMQQSVFGQRIIDAYLGDIDSQWGEEVEASTHRGERSITLYYCEEGRWVHSVESEVKEEGGGFVAIGGVANSLMGKDTIQDYINSAVRRVGPSNVCVFTVTPMEYVIPTCPYCQLMAGEHTLTCPERHHYSDTLSS